MKYSKIPMQFRSQTAAMLHDLAVVPIAWYLSYWLRFDIIPPDMSTGMLTGLVVIVPIQLLIFTLFGLYRGIGDMHLCLIF
jgi:FlaA1/EpsC-like NDP-sugar epimerase